MARQGFHCERIDRTHFTDSMIEQIKRRILEAKIVVFLAEGHNPNAYLEAGYAQALGTEVVIIVDEYDNLPFDVRDDNAIAYHGDLLQLEQKLEQFIKGLTGYSNLLARSVPAGVREKP
jgi:hypothetical protein